MTAWKTVIGNPVFEEAFKIAEGRKKITWKGKGYLVPNLYMVRVRQAKKFAAGRGRTFAMSQKVT